jgi:hypothetical protein
VSGRGHASTLARDVVSPVSAPLARGGPVADRVRALQSSAGNAAVNRLLRSPSEPAVSPAERANIEARARQFAELPETERHAIDQEAARRHCTRDDVVRDRNRIDSLPTEIRAIVMPGDRRPDPGEYAGALRLGAKLGEFTWEDWALFQRRGVAVLGGLRATENAVDMFTRERADDRAALARIRGTERLLDLVVKFNEARKLGMTPDRYERFPQYHPMLDGLAAAGFRGVADYESALARYYLLFRRRANEIALTALAASEDVVNSEIARYSDSRKLAALFADLAPVRRLLEEDLKPRGGDGAGSKAPTPADNAKDEVRRLAAKYPSLADPELDVADLGADTPEAVGATLRKNGTDRLDNIHDTRERIARHPDMVLQLNRVRDLTRQELGAEDSTVGWRIVQGHLDEIANQERFKSEALALFAIGLGMVTFGTGTLVVLGDVGELALGAYQAHDEWERYQAAAAAAHSSLDPEESLSSQDPSRIWFALALMNVGLSAVKLSKALRSAKGPLEVLERTGDGDRFRAALEQVPELTPDTRAALDRARVAREEFKDAWAALVKAATRRAGMNVDPTLVPRALVVLGRGFARMGIRRFEVFIETIRARRELLTVLGVTELTAEQENQWRAAFNKGVSEYDATRPVIKVPFSKGTRTVTFRDKMLLDGKAIRDGERDDVLKKLGLTHTDDGHGVGREARSLGIEARNSAAKDKDGMISQWASDEAMLDSWQKAQAEANAGHAIATKNGKWMVELPATADVGSVYVANSRVPTTAGVRKWAPFAEVPVAEIAPNRVWAFFKLKKGVYEIDSIYPVFVP